VGGTLRRLAALALCVAAPIAFTKAQDATADTSDKVIPEAAPAPAVNWKGQAWWKPLAQCSLVYQAAPQNSAKSYEFLSAAMDRVVADRRIEMDAAMPVVVGFNQSTGRRRASLSIDVLGTDGARSVCDALMAQFREAVR
jgi:hypothetical protein